MKITYSVVFKSNGKITALHLNILIDAGPFIDLSPFTPYMVVAAVKKYNWGALSFDVKLCKTNKRADQSCGPRARRRELSSLKL